MLVDTCQQEVPGILSELMSPDGFVLCSLVSWSETLPFSCQSRNFESQFTGQTKLIDGIRPTLENHAHDINHFSIIH